MYYYYFTYFNMHYVYSYDFLTSNTQLLYIYIHFWYLPTFFVVVGIALIYFILLLPIIIY